MRPIIPPWHHANQARHISHRSKPPPPPLPQRLVDSSFLEVRNVDESLVSETLNRLPSLAEALHLCEIYSEYGKFLWVTSICRCRISHPPKVIHQYHDANSMIKSLLLYTRLSEWTSQKEVFWSIHINMFPLDLSTHRNIFMHYLSFLLFLLLLHSSTRMHNHIRVKHKFITIYHGHLSALRLLIKKRRSHLSRLS